ncbi:MAG: MFS transporter [Armatimonadota bacterium]|nr:MFS transporter [Armatimonadota bacterium]MDR7440028.1 MFS transporter [Armatimonadota bacterium]MDR7562501.1 MFS transporter [Armatimonadota bacterium]MDR7601385.1 MFS transporter [Armatimonadota bacterium]
MFRAFRHPAYRMYWLGMAVSQVGTWMQATAQAFFVYERTGSALQTGVVTVAFTLPSLLFSLFGGAVADRYDRRRLLLLTQTGFLLSAGLLAGLTFGGWVQIWHLMAFAFVNGFLMAMDAPVRQAILPALVSREDLQNAIGLNAAMFNGSRIFGPALAGLIYQMGGPGWCFLLNALSYLAVILPMARIRVDSQVDRHSPLLDHLLGGLRYVRGQRVVRSLLLLLAAVGMFGFTWTVLSPAFTVRILHGGPLENGYLLTAVGVGSTLGALRVAGGGASHRPGRFVLTSAAATGISLLAFSTTRHLLAALACLSLTGFFLTSFMSATNSTIQSLVEDRYRGRVMSLYTLALIGSGPPGSLLAGSLADLVGVPASLALNGILVALSAGVCAVLVPDLARLDGRVLLRPTVLRSGGGGGSGG